MNQNLAQCSSIFDEKNAVVEERLDCQVPSSVLDNSVFCIRDGETVRALSNKELVEIFPQAKQTLTLLIKQDEQTLREHRILKDNIYNATYDTCKIFERDIVADLVFTALRTDFIEKKPQRMSALDFFYDSGDTELRHLEFTSDRLIRNKRLLALYKLSSKKNKTSYDNFQQQIEKARAFPIENLIKTNHAGFAVCPLHSEATPSFHINKKKNYFKCFSCNEGGDVISLVMKLNSCSFKEAVNKLQ